MVLFGLETEKSEKVLEWFSQTQERGQSDNMVKNPFKMRTKFFILDEKILLIIDMIPLWPNIIPLIGWSSFFAILILWGPRWFMIPPILIGSTIIFWTMPFYYIMAVRGIRKAGYHGPIKFASHKRIIEGAVF